MRARPLHFQTAEMSTTPLGPVLGPPLATSIQPADTWQHPSLARDAARLLLRFALLCGVVLLIACLHGWALGEGQMAQTAGPTTHALSGIHDSQID